jgi:hypothetical protein
LRACTLATWPRKKTVAGIALAASTAFRTLAPDEGSAAAFVFAGRESDKATRARSVQGTMGRRVKLAARDVLGNKDPPFRSL